MTCEVLGPDSYTQVTPDQANALLAAGVVEPHHDHLDVFLLIKDWDAFTEVIGDA